MLKVVTDGSSVVLPDYNWWLLLEHPPAITVKNLSEGSITVSASTGVIDSGLSSVLISSGDALQFQASVSAGGWAKT